MAAHRPDYYKFDQWFFLKMYEMGLAYKKMTQVNWCRNDQATLSNEQASAAVSAGVAEIPVDEKRFGTMVFENDRLRRTTVDDMAEIEDGLGGKRFETSARLDRQKRRRVCRVQSSKFKVQRFEDRNSESRTR